MEISAGILVVIGANSNHGCADFHWIFYWSDEHSDIDLDAKGILVQRFSNEEVLHHIETVMLQIYKTIAMRNQKYLTIDVDSDTLS